MTLTAEPIDVVFTWVDDSFPGYLETLNRFAADKRDLNPNRTRDNLDLIRYAMRSVKRNMPGIRRIHLFSCRPQVPAWLDTAHPQIRVHHHDQVMDPAILPTFSSFCIVSHLHLLPGLSQRFVYFEDDMLALSPGLTGALSAPDGRPRVHLDRLPVTPADKLDHAKASPWNLALANADAVLSARFGAGDGLRRHISHGPQLIDKTVMSQAFAAFPEVIAATRADKFRSGRAVPAEVFVPHFALATGQAVAASRAEVRRAMSYVSIENLTPWTWAQLKAIDLRAPLSVTLNDSFGDRPNPRVVAMVRRWLAARFPDPAPWERMDAAAEEKV